MANGSSRVLGGFAAALLGLASALAAGDVLAADCGGAVACQCGDRMIADYTLPGDLNSCPGVGLRVVAGVLDCADHQVSGSGEPSEEPGLWLDNATGASVRNCRVRNYTDGILVDGGSGNVVADNVVFNNVHGIWVGSGATGTVIEGNEVRDNSDEGIHLGSGTGLAVVSNNAIHNNDGENLYLLSSDGNTISDNVLDQSKSSAIFVKHSSDNTFTDNQVLKRPIVIRGDSHGNAFSGTVLASGGFLLKALEEPDLVWTYPSTTTVTGGDIDASTCFEFVGSFGNTVTDVHVDSCRHFTELEFGGLVPYDNSVSVLDESPGDDGNGSGGGAGGSGGRGKVKFNKKNPDVDHLKVAYFFLSSSELHPDVEDITITLSDMDSVVYSADLPAGAMEEKSVRNYKYKDKSYSLINGLREVKIRHYGGTLWRLDIKARAELVTADHADMTLSWTIGDDDFASTDTWTETKRGWRLKND